jgi:hypothetical protein
VPEDRPKIVEKPGSGTISIAKNPLENKKFVEFWKMKSNRVGGPLG